MILAYATPSINTAYFAMLLQIYKSISEKQNKKQKLYIKVILSQRYTMSLATFVKIVKKSQNTSNNQVLRIFDIESNRQNSMLRIAIWRMFAIFVGDIMNDYKNKAI